MFRKRYTYWIAICVLGSVPPSLAQVYHLPLNYNFNGIVNADDPVTPDEPNAPDDPDGYRSISDRGLVVDGGSISFGTDPVVGFDGISYSIVTTGHTLDIVHLGNRNTTSGGVHAFDPNVDGDNVGIQPDWLPDPNQGGPQTTDVSGEGIVFDATAEFAVLYQISNGGGTFDITLDFTDPNVSVTVTAQGPDWFQDQSPGTPGPGLVSQAKLGVYAGTSGEDNWGYAETLNVAEAVISVPELIADGFDDVTGGTLQSVTFSNRSNTDAGYAIIAATVRTGLAPPANDDCANAIAISEGTVSGSNARATGSDMSSCGTNDTTSVWYAYTASSTGLAQASTCGSTLDTVLSVYDSCGGTELGCDDNTCAYQSIVQWPVTAGTTYMIRVAGANDAEGNFTLDVQTGVPEYTVTPLPLNYNWNGLVDTGEAGFPDAPDGFRAISDRGINRALYGGGFLGTTGIPYDVPNTPDVVDLVHLGDRAGVGWPFDPNADGDDFGTQPAWLTDPNQGEPQVSDVSALNLTLDSTSEIGVIYQISNGGGNFEVQLGFSDSSTATVTLNGPDWFGDQSPDPNAGDGVAVQTQMGIFPGTYCFDSACDNLNLNVAEGIISVDELLNDGVADVAGKTLTSITFQNADTSSGYAIFAATVRSAAGGASCPGDCNGDGMRNITDLGTMLANYGGPAGGCDTNGDGTINITDLGFLLANFGQNCP